MTNCHLIVDSCCDIPADIINADNIELLSFTYEMNGGVFTDDLFQSSSPHDFYEAMNKGAEPKTAQLAIPVLTEVFERAAREGIPTVYLSFSSGLSGSFDTALIVRDQILEKYPDFELYVVDTALASIAEGLLVFEAIQQWERGLSAKELAEWAEEAKYFVDCEFMIEDLAVLRRGGRIPASVAVAGAALDVKPMLTIDVEGKLQVIGVARGRKKGIKQLCEYYKKNKADSKYGNFVFVGNADCPKDMSRLCEMLKKEDESIIFIESSIGPVIGSHVGPGMLAVVFWGKDKRNSLSVAQRITNKIKGASNE